MFNRNTNESKPTRSTAAKATAPAHSLVSLVQGTHIEGTVEADGDIRVDGTIKGKLFCRAKVIVGPSGHIEGEVHCLNAVVEGSVNGALEVEDLLNIRESARIHGRVQTGKLIVQAGALFNVECQMGQENPEEAAKQTESKAPQEKGDRNSTRHDKQTVGKEKHASST